MNKTKRFLTVLLMATAALSVSASPASARPGGPAEFEEQYRGPAYGTASWFAGRSATGCGDTFRVYGEPKCK